MRIKLLLVAGSLALAGCVAPVPVTPVPSTPAAPAPNVLDNTTRAIARDVVNREMAKRLPGVNVAPYTDCVINNSTMAEMADIAGRSVNSAGSAANSVAVIVQRPATTQCIAKVAAQA